jgi:hypothetical protein
LQRKINAGMQRSEDEYPRAYYRNVTVSFSTERTAYQPLEIERCDAKKSKGGREPQIYRKLQRRTMDAIPNALASERS